MQRSSDKIGALAAALAKAQAELANPEKSLTATIHPRSRARASGPFAMPPSPPASTSSANAWASMRSQPSRPPRSTGTAA